MANPWTALYLAYSIVWLGVFVYLIYIHMRQRVVERDIRTLKEELHKHAK